MINNRHKNLTNFLENRDTASVAAKIRAIQNSMGGISYAEAKNIYDEQNRPSSTPVEEETGGSLLRVGESYTVPESEDKAIEEEVRSRKCLLYQRFQSPLAGSAICAFWSLLEL